MLREGGLCRRDAQDGGGSACSEGSVAPRLSCEGDARDGPRGPARDCAEHCTRVAQRRDGQLVLHPLRLPPVLHLLLLAATAAASGCCCAWRCPCAAREQGGQRGRAAHAVHGALACSRHAAGGRRPLAVQHPSPSPASSAASATGQRLQREACRHAARALLLLLLLSLQRRRLQQRRLQRQELGVAGREGGAECQRQRRHVG